MVIKMLNFWRKYPRRKPKESGRYQCTVMYGYNLDNVRVMDLYFDTLDGGKWLDDRRQSVFSGYKVYKDGRVPLEENRVFTDGLCERDHVIAWRKLPKAYGERRKRRND